MEQPVLDPEELAALRDAIQETQAPASSNDEPPPRRVKAVALISDDRAAESARPQALRLAQRWMEAAKSRVALASGVQLEFERAGAEIVEASTLRDELPRTWLHGLKVMDRPGVALLSIGGPMVELLAARLLGASGEAPPNLRPPSRTTLKLFGPLGETIAAALIDAWRDEQRCTASSVAAPIEDWRAVVAETESVIVVTLSLSGAVPGRVRLLAHAETLVPPAAPPRLVPAPPGAIDEVLGAVPVQLRVELGRARLTMAETAALRPGLVLMLQQPVDGLLPVSCGGVVKAMGRPLLSRGAMAVEIVNPADIKGAGQ